MPVYAPVFVPAALAGFCFLISWRAWRRRTLARDGHWGGAAAVALGYFAGHVLLASWPPIPPSKAVDWLAYLALAGGAAGLTQRYWGKRWYAAWPLMLLLGCLFAAVLLRSYIQHTWGRLEGILWISGLGVATAVLWNTLERLASKRTGASLPLSLWLICAASSTAFVFSGSGLLGQLAGALAAVFGAAVVLAWWAPGLSLASGTFAAFVPVYAGLLIQAYFYSELPFLSAVLLYLAPFALCIGERRSIYYMRPWKAALKRLLIVGAPLAIAVGIAWYLIARTAGGEYYY